MSEQIRYKGCYLTAAVHVYHGRQTSCTTAVNSTADGRHTISLTQERGNYYDVISPAISRKALFLSP